MTTQAYRDWVAAGRPWRLARPVQEYRSAFLAAGWPAETVGTIGDESHLQSDHPQDHTPFSVTGWPLTHPYPYVTAIDVGHNPGAGRDMVPVVSRWIFEAKAGWTPWVKYVVFQGKRWDVRNGWTPVAASGHYDHAHVSMRTDHVSTSVGSWPIVKGGTPVTTTEVGRQVWDETIHSPALNRTEAAREWLKSATDALHVVQQLQSKLDNLSGPQLGSISQSLTSLAAKLGLVGDVLADISARVGQPVDPAALGAALAGEEAFVGAVATAVAARLGMIPTATEIARAIGELDWHGSVR